MQRTAHRAPGDPASANYPPNGTKNLLNRPRSQPDHPRGCLSIQGALACSEDAEPVKQAMIVLRKGGEDALRKRMTEAQKSGELPEDTNPTDFARFLSTVIAGLGVLAANGATRAEMKRVADFVLRALRMA